MRSATKNKTGKDKGYLAFLHTLPCVIPHGGLLHCVNEARIMDAAHLGAHGLSQKAPDRQAVPMCRFHHQTGAQALHKIGPKKFWKLHGLDPEEIIAKLNARYDQKETT